MLLLRVRTGCAQAAQGAQGFAQGCAQGAQGLLRVPLRVLLREFPKNLSAHKTTFTGPFWEKKYITFIAKK